MTGKADLQTRLCPNCANNIRPGAETCPYCKAEIAADDGPQWLKRGDSFSESRADFRSRRSFSLPAKWAWPAALVAVAFAAYLAGGYRQRSEHSLAAQVNLKELQAKDQMIQSQEAQLAQTRRQLEESGAQIAQLQSQLEEGRKELSATQLRLAAASRQAEQARLDATRAAAGRSSRAPVTTAANRAPPAGRSAQPGVYETVQATAVYENPSTSSRVITQIGGGTRINVVNANGEWLEVRSRHGNPPGYVRSADARPIGRVN